MSALNAFFARVEQSSDCWVWTGPINQDGYGYFTKSPEVFNARAHRYAYEQLVGDIPLGLVLDHLCRNRACVNPDHLDPVTPAINAARGEVANRTHCPQGHPYDEENTMRRDRGNRECRACMRKRASDYARRKRASDPAWVERKKQYLRGYYAGKKALASANSTTTESR